MTFDPFYGKQGFARRLFTLRTYQLDHCPQSLFAEWYGFTCGQYRDLEQGRSRPILPIRVLVAAIEADPKWMREIAKEERARTPDWGGAGMPE